MKKFLLSLMLLVMFAPFALHADEIIIGNGTSNTNTAPFGNAYAYSWTEMIYQSSEIGQACEITSLSFQCATPGFFGSMNVSELKVYLAEVTKSELAQNNFTPESDLTLVYTGANVVIGEEEWETLTLDTPFSYSGTNNLAIVISKSASASNMNIRWTSAQIANSIMFDFSDSDPAGALFPNANSYTGGAGYLFNQRPIVKLGTTGSSNPDEGEDEGDDNENQGTPTDEIVVGTADASTANVPFRTTYKYSWTETIYPKAELCEAGTIYSIAYHCATVNNNGYTLSDVDVYLAETSKDIYSSASDWTPESEFTLVYSGSNVELGDEEWETFVFDTPFEYSGDNNLVIAIGKKANSTTTVSELKWYYSMPDEGNVLYTYSDNYQEYGNFPTGAGYDPGYQRADVKIAYTPAEGGDDNEGGEGNEGEEGESNVLFSYDFNDQSMEGWRAIDQDGDGKTWEISMSNGMDATSCLVSHAYSGGEYLEPDNIVVTETAYEISENSELSWYVASLHNSYCEEHYAIVISTDNETFTNVWEETLPLSYTSDRTLDLSAYAGQTVYVGFRHYDCTGYEATGLLIDNVVLTGTIDEGNEGEGNEGEESVVFFYDFNDGTFNGMTSIDKDGDTYEWIINQEAGIDQTDCISSWAYLGFNLNPENYLITTSTYTINNGDYLEWYISTTDPYYYSDVYGVVISTDGENFQVILDEAFEAPTEGFEVRTADLSQYAGQNVHIGFVHHNCSNIANGIRIDNVKYVTVSGNEGGNEEPEVAEGDTWENAIEVASFPFTSTPDYANLNNDYTLPGETQDGADVVYKLTFTEETTFNAAIEGANGKLALYAEDFNGEDGPGADNYYVVNTVDPNAPTSFFYDFEDGSLADFTTTDNDGDSYSWYVYEYGIDGNSLSSDSYILGVGVLTPDNYIYTTEKYAITSQSELTYKVNWNFAEYYSVVVSTDGVNFTTVYETELTGNGLEEKVIDLSAYAGQMIHIGFRHHNCSDGLRLLIDDLKLSNGNEGGDDNNEGGDDDNDDDNGEYASNFSENFNAYGDGISNIDGWRIFQYDTDTFNWETCNSYGSAGPDNSTCILSISYATGVLTPDNFIVTTSKYAITSTSTFSFDASPYSYMYMDDKFGVVISEDNENWTVVYTDIFNSESEHGYVNKSVDLSAYAGKNVYIGLRHYDCGSINSSGVLVDNIVLSDGAKRNGGNTLAMTVPAGTYYLVASATEAFSVNIDVEGQEEIAKVSFEVEVINANSAKTTARPNEFTAEYHYSVYETAEVEAAGGVEALALELREDETPYTEIDIWTWEWLEPESEYYIIGTAKNAAGEWGPTTHVVFTTPEAEEEYDAAEVTVEISTINATSVVVNTTANEATVEYHIGAISKAMFDYMGEDVIVAALQNDGVPYTGNNEHTLGNLNAATEYYVIVTAKNAGDEWAPATIESFTTLDSDPEPQIAEVTITVEVLGATSVKSTATPNEFAVGYTYSIYDKAEVEASGADAIAAELQAEGISYTEVDVWTWENLTANTEYYFIGTAQNAAGEWGPTTSVSFKTDEDGLVELNSMVSIYPNPASSVIYVKYDSNAQVSLIDMTGRCVKATEISGDATINVEDLEKGMYIIKIQDGDNTMINRVVVK